VLPKTNKVCFSGKSAFLKRKNLREQICIVEKTFEKIVRYFEIEFLDDIRTKKLTCKYLKNNSWVTLISIVNSKGQQTNNVLNVKSNAQQ